MSPRTFNYMDKAGRFIPWIDKQIIKYSATADINPCHKEILKIFEKLKKDSIHGCWDWQPAE